MKIVILDADTVTTGDISLEKFKMLGDVTIYNTTTPENVIERIKDAEVVLCNKVLITADIMKQCNNLKYIGLFATGYNNIDLSGADEMGIVVCNAPEYSTNSVAQHVFAFILSHLSRIDEYNKTVADGDWVKSKLFSYFHLPTEEIAGQTLGIIGFGSIGKKVSQIALAFGMKVKVHTRTIPKNYQDIEFVDLDTLFTESDIITLHCPLNEQTKNLINSKTLSKMKKSTVLINTSRGPVINEYDLAQALNNNIIAKACIDVVSVEPMDKDNPLREAKNCIITPHIAWAPQKTRQRLVEIVADNLKQFQNKNPINIVNKGRA